MASPYNILIDQGATYTLAITYKDSAGAAINLTNYTAAMQLRLSSSGRSIFSTMLLFGLVGS